MKSAQALPRDHSALASYVAKEIDKWWQEFKTEGHAHLSDGYLVRVSDLTDSSVQEGLTKDAEVMRLLATGEWQLTKIIPQECFTAEANAMHAWMVERNLPPYCGIDGVRAWRGATAHEAFSKAMAAIGAARGRK